MNKKIKHGGSSTRLYKIWCMMKQRCFNNNYDRYKDYGGRGITICPEWTESYIAFRDWALSHGYKEELQINRINNNGNYEPNNCEWVTRKENMQNKRNNVLTIEKVYEIREKYKTNLYSTRGLAEIFKVSKSLIWCVISKKEWGNI